LGEALLLRLQNEALLFLHGHQVGVTGCGCFAGGIGAFYYYKVNHNRHTVGVIFYRVPNDKLIFFLPLGKKRHNG